MLSTNTRPFISGAALARPGQRTDASSGTRRCSSLSCAPRAGAPTGGVLCNDAHVPRSGQSQKRDGPSRALCARNVFPVWLPLVCWLLVFGSESTAPHCCCCCCMLLATSYLGTLHFVALLSRLGDALSVRNSSWHLLGARHLDRVDPLSSPSPPFSFAGSASPLRESFTATIQYHHTPSTLHCMRRRRRWWFRGGSG